MVRLSYLLLAGLLITGCSSQSLPQTDFDIVSRRELLQTARADAEPATLTPRSAADPNMPLTLRDALELTLTHNPELKAAFHETGAARARQLQAGLRENPMLDIDVEDAAGSGSRSGFDGAETTIQLGQLIELKGKPRKRTQVASLEKDLAEIDYQAKRLDILTDTTKAFVNVLAAQEQVALADEWMELSGRVLNTVIQRVEAGKVSPVEKTKSEIAFANIRIEREKATHQLQSARRQLAVMWGGKSPAFAEAAGRLDLVHAIPTAEQLEEMVAQNPDLAAWIVEVQQRRAVYELEKAKAVPDITIRGGVKRFNETDDNAVVFGVSIPLPVANRNQGAILAARHNIAKAGEEQKAAEARVHADLAAAYQMLSNAYMEATELNNRVLEGAQSVFDASAEGYREGKFDYLDVLDAQRTLFEVKGRYIEALSAYHQARTDVERLIGQRIDSVQLNQPLTLKDSTHER
jgi:cobalt-zinc-cadmium efflux system outer membrane protein